jgi:cell wall assembly regulator SMI1
MGLAQLLQQVIDCLPMSKEEVELSLAAPATDADLMKLHFAAEHPVPASLAELYRYCDGERWGREEFIGIFFDYCLMGTQKTIGDIALLRSTASFWQDSMHELNLQSDPAGTVQPMVYVDGWFPFASDSGGNYFAVDMVPDVNGTVGQIISFGRDERVNYQFAPDMKTFLEFVASCYRARRFHSLFGESFHFVEWFFQAARHGIEHVDGPIPDPPRRKP